MLKLNAVARPAAALVAAVVLVFAASCGDDDDSGATPTPGTSETPSESSATPAPATPSAEGFTLTGGGEGDFHTGSHSLALGDFNDDGEIDLLAGAPQADGPDGRRFDGGAAYVIFGPLAGEERGVANADITVYGSFAGDNLGYATLAGDLNGDDIDDVLIGAPGVTAGFDPRTDQGRVYVFFGGSDLGDEPVLDLETDVYDFTVTGSEGFSRLSNSMAMGDINADGTQDLVVASPFAGREPGTAPGGPRTTLGEVYVIYGGDDLSGEFNIARDEYDVLISGKEAQGQFGGALAVADFDGDGNDDIAIGAHRSSAADDRLQSGVLYVFNGADDLPQRMSTQDGDEDAIILGPAASAAFGFPLTAGDFDGDGTPDLAAGAQLEAPDGLLSAGTLRVISGGDLDSNIDLASDEGEFTIPGTDPGQLLPTSLAAAAAGEDAPSVLVVGNQLATSVEQPGGGHAYVIMDGVTQVTNIAELGVAIGGEAGDRAGNAVAAAGVDSGTAVAVLAPGAGGGIGAVWVFFYGQD